MKLEFIPTGIEQIDALIKGFYPSELIVIGARPGCGKTTFLCELAKNFCADETGLFFSLQTEKKLLIAKLLSCISKVPLSEVLDNKLNISDFDKKYDSLKLTIFDDSNLETDKLISMVHKISKKTEIKIIFIDYIGLLFSENDMRPIYEQYNSTLIKLKKLARELNIVIVFTLPVSSSSALSEDEALSLSRIRGCGDLESICDLVIFLERKENELNRFRIAKNNRGTTSTGYLFPEGHEFAEKVLQAALLNNAKHNPIFIYGKSGSGKTFLINQFIESYSKDYPNRKIKYFHGYDFYDAFISSIKTHKIRNFKEEFWEQDCIIIDGLEDFADKYGIQEELIRTIERSKMQKKQLILTSIYPPGAGGYTPEFQSAIISGLFIRIDK